MHSLVRITLLATLCSCKIISAQAQSSPSSQNAAASISGRIVIGDKPAPGVPVSTQNIASEVGPLDWSKAKATTDEDGRYRLTGLAPGRYSVTVLSSVYVLPSNSPPGSLMNKDVTLKENEQLDHVDFSVVRGAVITGKVADADGRLLVGNRVTVMTIDAQGRKRPVSNPGSEIDDRGIYRVFGLPAGRYTVSAGYSIEGGSNLGSFGIVHRRTFHPNVTDEAQARVIELGESEEATGIDITLGRPVKTYAASGRVILAETGQPLSNTLFGYGVRREGSSTPPAIAGTSSRTSARGEFQIEGLVPGRYLANIANGSTLGLLDEGTDFYGEPVLFAITDGDVTGLEIKAHRTSSMTGMIALENADPALLNQFSQFQLYASPAELGIGTINPDGSFLITGLRPGKVQLTLRGPQGAQLVRIERDGASQPGMTIDVAPGDQVAGIRLIASQGTGAIRGEVKIIGSAPQGLRLLVHHLRVGAGPGSSRSVPVDTRGRFVIEKLPPGDYELQLGAAPIFMTPPSSLPTASLPQLPLPPKQQVTVNNGAEAQVTFTLDLSKGKEPQP